MIHTRPEDECRNPSIEIFGPKSSRSKNQLWWGKCNNCGFVAESSHSKTTIEQDLQQHKKESLARGNNALNAW